MILSEVLAIIRLSLELALEMLKAMPDAEKAAFFKRHNERMEFWQNLAEKLHPHDQLPRPAK